MLTKCAKALQAVKGLNKNAVHTMSVGATSMMISAALPEREAVEGRNSN